jgi:hypothetical protein
MIVQFILLVFLLLIDIYFSQVHTMDKYEFIPNFL